MRDVTATAPRQPAAGDVVELSFPHDTKHVATARAVAASLGAEAGLDVDEIDDLRLAVDEALSVVIDRPAADQARLVVRFTATADSVTARVGCEPAAESFGRDDLDDLAVRILGAVTDSFEAVDGTITVTKRSSRDGT